MERRKERSERMSERSAYLHDIIRWKGHDIVLLGVKWDKTIIKSPLLNDYFCAYTRLKKRRKKNLPNITFGETGGKVIGVDTAHYQNEKMTFEECRLDALRQIKQAILENEKRVKKKRK